MCKKLLQKIISSAKNYFQKGRLEYHIKEVTKTRGQERKRMKVIIGLRGWRPNRVERLELDAGAF